MAAAFAFHGRKGVEYGFISFIVFSLLTTFKLVENLSISNKVIIMTLITVFFGLVGYKIAFLKIFNYTKEENLIRKPIERFNQESLLI
jgi:hypothetical protein